MLFASNLKLITSSMIFKPNLSDEFADFFIDKEILLTPTEKSAGLSKFVHIKPTKLNKEELAGFTRVCRKGRWFLGSSSKIVQCNDNHVLIQLFPSFLLFWPILYPFFLTFYIYQLYTKFVCFRLYLKMKTVNILKDSSMNWELSLLPFSLRLIIDIWWLDQNWEPSSYINLAKRNK